MSQLQITSNKAREPEKDGIQLFLEMIHVTRELAGSAFKGIDLRMSRLIVWGVHNHQLDQVWTYCDAKGLSFENAELQALAAIYRNVFRVDVDRQEQPNCYLCDQLLPPQEELLCECYLRSVVGEYVVPDMISIEAQKKRYPHKWGYRLQATLMCQSCRSTFNVSVGDVAKQLAQGKDWIAPRWCRACYKRPVRTPTTNPPPRKSYIPVEMQNRLPVTGES